MTSEQRTWLKAKQQSRKITDKLGNTVDSEILETVTIMRLLGFNTTSSCGGHLRRITSGPYVIFQSAEARRNAALAREVPDVRSERYQRLRKKADYFRALDLQRMSDYLEQFYQVQPFHYPQHLIVQSMPMSLNILKCHDAEIAWAATSEEKKHVLRNNQAEMIAFTEYLKNEYFAND